VQTSDNSCDLRGLRAEDAVALATTFMDRALGFRARVVFLVHVHGTGAVREALRRALPLSAYVAKFRPGGPQEGGDGVTVVWLK
jgi:DNA mismatch repair protein MutS2